MIFMRPVANLKPDSPVGREGVPLNWTLCRRGRTKGLGSSYATNKLLCAKEIVIVGPRIFDNAPMKDLIWNCDQGEPP